MGGRITSGKLPCTWCTLWPYAIKFACWQILSRAQRLYWPFGGLFVQLFFLQNSSSEIWCECLYYMISTDDIRTIAKCCWQVPDQCAPGMWLVAQCSLSCGTMCLWEVEVLKKFEKIGSGLRFVWKLTNRSFFDCIRFHLTTCEVLAQ